MTLPIEEEDTLHIIIQRNGIIQVIRTLAMICGKRSIGIEETNKQLMKIAQKTLVALADYLDTIYVR
jgi:hypothetical protein